MFVTDEVSIGRVFNQPCHHEHGNWKYMNPSKKKVSDSAPAVSL